MTAGQQDQPQAHGDSKARPKRSRSLAAHPAFAPMLGIWGAALGGLSVIVLPVGLFARAGRQAGLMLPGIAVQAAIAAMAAIVLGALLYRIARGSGRKRGAAASNAPSIVSMATRHFHTIDPQRDLGSASLDEPVTDRPFVYAGADDIVMPVIDLPPAPPRALDLEEFAVLPGRNAVWVEDVPSDDPSSPPPPQGTSPNGADTAPFAAPAPKPHPPEPRSPHPGATALAQLRATPPEHLSMIQMVERFAGALHEHRAAPPGKAITGQDVAAREAALAEALRALAALSGDTSTAAAPASAADEPLREAITRLQGLQGMRGAA